MCENCPDPFNGGGYCCVCKTNVPDLRGLKQQGRRSAVLAGVCVVAVIILCAVAVVIAGNK